MSDYNPNSGDSLFSKILIRLDNQDVVLQRIDQRGEQQDDRIKKLEDWKLTSQVKVGTIAAVFSILGSMAFNWWVAKK